MSLPERYADFVTRRSKLVVALMVVATLVVGAGAGSIDSGLSIARFESDSTEAQKLDYVETNFTTEGENTSVVQVIVRGDNVLSNESLVETLRFQQAVRENETVGPTLRDRQPISGLANLVAITAMMESGGTDPPGGGGAPAAGAATPPLEAQIKQLESMSAAEVEQAVSRVLDSDAPTVGRVDPFSLLSTEYEPGSATATGHVLFLFQDNRGEAGESLPKDLLNAQLAIEDNADQTISGESFVFGAGIVNEKSGQATGESFALISPVALLLILVVLGIAYRDVLDVLLGLLGVVLVLVWMGGVMGWAGIGVTQLLIAVPFLLIGLSIDFALHVVMRNREAQTDDPDRSLHEAMRRGLGGVIVAIGAATVTTAVGFASNAVSPIQSIQEFGIVSAAGIISAFLVFGVLLPPLKLELDQLLQRFGFSRRKAPFGRSGMVGRLLSSGGRVARRAPVVVLVIALLLSAGGGIAATDIDTSLDQVDFLPREAPGWMDLVPEPFQPGDYELRANAIYLNEQFVQSMDRSRADILIEGSITEEGTLDRVLMGRQELENTSTAVRLGSGNLRVTGPVETIDRVAADNETVATLVEANDPDKDGVPEENLGQIYGAVANAAPEEAGAVFYREDGQYRALRLSVGLAGSAGNSMVTREMRGVATAIEDDTDLTVTATGQPIVMELVNRGLLRTLIEGFVITFGLIAVFLTTVFWRRYGTLSLGLVVITPVLLVQGWIFGTMYLAGISLNTETAILASISIGIGVDYAIHIGERYIEERSVESDVVAALDRTVRGTGGALLASAVSTAGGFGVLMLALVPSLQRFGFLTAVAIAYAFLASVLVLPGLLVLWDRYVGVDHLDTVSADETPTSD